MHTWQWNSVSLSFGIFTYFQPVMVAVLLFVLLSSILNNCYATMIQNDTSDYIQFSISLIHYKNKSHVKFPIFFIGFSLISLFSSFVIMQQRNYQNEYEQGFLFLLNFGTTCFSLSLRLQNKKTSTNVFLGFTSKVVF